MYFTVRDQAIAMKIPHGRRIDKWNGGTMAASRKAGTDEEVKSQRAPKGAAAGEESGRPTHSRYTGALKPRPPRARSGALRKPAV